MPRPVQRAPASQLYRDCDALLNICGATVLNDDHLRARRRVYVETDPVTNQLELANGKEKTREVLRAHDMIVTYGENYGAPDCGVPLDGFRYLKTRQPIDLELWPVRLRRAGRELHHDRQLEAERPRRRLERRDLPLEQAPRVPEVRRPAAPAPRAALRAVPERRRRGRPQRSCADHGWQLSSPLTHVARALRLPGLLPRLARASGRWPRTRTCGCAAAGSASATPATWPRASP